MSIKIVYSICSGLHVHIDASMTTSEGNGCYMYILASTDEISSCGEACSGVSLNLATTINCRTNKILASASEEKSWKAQAQERLLPSSSSSVSVVSEVRLSKASVMNGVCLQGKGILYLCGTTGDNV